MKQYLCVSFFILVLIGCTEAPKSLPASTSNAAQTKQLTESEKLNQWFDVKYEEQLAFSPITLTRLGRKEFYDQIDDMSEQGEAAKLAWMAASVAELESQFDYDQLDTDSKISYDLWLFQYEQARMVDAYSRHRYLLTQMWGMQSYLPTMMINYHKVSDAADIEAYISRLSGIGRAIEQLSSRVAINADEGVKAPYFAYEGVIKQSKSIISGRPFDPASEVDSSFLADIKTKIGSLVDTQKLDKAQADKFIKAAEQTLLSDVLPAYSALIHQFENDLPNIDTVAKGVWALPNGNSFYNMMLKLQTTTDLTADEIHQLGLQEVTRLRQEMENIKQKEGFDGTLQAFFAYIKSDTSDERFYYPNTDEGRQGYINDATAFIKAIEAKLPEFFGVLPKADLVVKRVESFREQPGAPQHYFAGSRDGKTPGVYYAHLLDMTSMPKNEMEAIAYHEGIPGHHMQVSIAQELEGVPKFRTTFFVTAYTEGWGLYAESLAKEMGGYRNPMSDFGRLVTEIWRAIRLVVDTGIHSKGWTEEEAIQYFKDNSPISDGQIKAEVQRYFVRPGQATAYKIGMLKIQEQRKKAETALGDKFDIREFHDLVLGNGEVPLTILERIVDDWIGKKKSAS